MQKFIIGTMAFAIAISVARAQSYPTPQFDGLGVGAPSPATVGDVNISGQYQINGSQLSASDLSNGVTGSGPIVLGTAPTIALSNATGLPLTTGVTGVLSVANGGTGTTTATGTGSIVLATTPTLTGPLTINPPSGTIDQAITTNQTGPSTGTASGDVFFNRLTMSYGANGGGHQIAGVQVNFSTGSSYTNTGETDAVSFAYIPSAADTSTGDKVALASGMLEAYSTDANLYGAAFGATCASGCSTPQLTGAEVDIIDAGTATTRIGFGVDNQGAAVATGVDTAYAIETSGPGTAAGAFQTGFYLYTEGGKLPQPLSNTANLFNEDYTGTIGNVFNFPNLTITGDFLNAPGLALRGNGEFTFSTADLYGTPPTASSGHVTYGAATVASGTATCPSGSIGTTSVSSCLEVNVGGTVKYIPLF